MKISVIMSVKNGESEPAFFHCIDSILNQTWTDFEFIICDDGSQDNTFFLLSKYQKKDKRILLLQNESNMGLAFSLNRCIQSAKGEILVRQDIDDISLLHRLDTLVKYHDQYPHIDIISSCVFYYNNHGFTKEMHYPEHPEKKDFLFTIPFKHGAMSFKSRMTSHTGDYLVAKRTRRCEDYELFMRAYAKGMTGYNIQEPLYCYFEDETTHKKRKYRYRVDEFLVRLLGFYDLKLYPKGIFYTIKPLLVGCIPLTFLEKLKQRYYGSYHGGNCE